MQEPNIAEFRRQYLNLVKSSVTNLLYLESEYNPIMPRGAVRRMILPAFQKAGIQLCHTNHGDVEKRKSGVDYTSIAHTMLSDARLENARMCVETVIQNNVIGDIIETGVLRGGCCIYMRAVLWTYGVTDRTVWLADSFEGLPAPNVEKYPADAGQTWHEFMGGEVAVEHVRRNFERYGLLDDQVRFLRGWFKDTLPTAPIERLAVIRLDGDLYESTMDAIVSLYPKLSPGGYCIVDDYYLECCRLAVEDYRKANNITETIVEIDGAGAYWQRR